MSNETKRLDSRATEHKKNSVINSNKFEFNKSDHAEFDSGDTEPEKTPAIDLDDWSDFTGDYQLSVDNEPINIQSLNKSDAIDFDKLVKQAAALFKAKKISRSNLASVMELRSIAAISTEWKTIKLSSVQQDKQNHFLQYNSASKEDWPTILTKIPENERFYTEVTINTDTLTDPHLYDLLFLAHQLGVIYIHDFNELTKQRFTYNQGIQTITFDIPSVSARDAFNQFIYGEDARPLVARVGVFTIDDIERSVRNKMRYGVFSYPGVEDTTEFHDIKAPIFYMSLHDELHRRLMSSVPTKSLDAYLAAIDLIREKTGIHWSGDIWNGIDLEIGSFSNMPIKNRNNPSLLTAHFEILLKAVKFSTSEEFGLFSPKDSSLDTLFILMLDMAVNTDKWNKLGIYPDLFTDAYYKNVFQFAKHHAGDVSNLTSAQQVAYLKSNWLKDQGIKSQINLVDCQFENRDNYLQVVSKKKIIGQTSKAMDIALNNYEIQVNYLTDTFTAQRNITDENILLLISKAQNVHHSIDKEIQSKPSLKQVKYLTKIIELTNLLLIDPTNQHLQTKYNALIKEKSSIPTKVFSAIFSFFATLKVLASSRAKEITFKEVYNNKLGFFKEKLATGYTRKAVKFREQTVHCPTSLKT